MAPGLVLFYGIALAIILGGALAVYLPLRRRAPALAVVAALLTAGTLVLVWPLPIHGGFTLLGEALYDEWSRSRAIRTEAREDRARASFVEDLSRRFAGELPFLARAPARGGWQPVTYAADAIAWLDTAHGQIWSPWLPLAGDTSRPTLEEAKARCRRHEPAGYWALPTEAEHALMWKAGGARVLPAAGGGTVSFVVDVDLRMEIPTYQLAPSGNAAARGPQAFAVRCVARGPGGPAGGYIKRDVPLDDWNRYQLSKSM